MDITNGEIKDEFLSQHLYSLLHELPFLGHFPIKAECRSGVVYLKGIVDSDERRHLAEELAEHMPGVRGVVNELSLFSNE